MIPITRKELYLNKIVGNNDYSIPEKPISEEEFFFAEILGEAVQAPEPFTRYQMYLAKIAKRDIEIPYPETRLEYYLAKAAGMDITVPVPITREEIYWSNYTAIMEFEVENVPPLAYKAIEGTLKNYRIYGNTVDAASVGDRTANLFDKENIQRGAILAGRDYAGYSYPESVVHYAYGINFDINRLCFKQLFTVTGINTISISGDYIFMFVEFPNGINSGEKSNWYSQNSPLTIEDKTFALIIKHADERAISDADIENIELMINSGSTALPYEPYCYRVPVTVTNGTDTETTNIYLPEQIKMVGDEAEYVDYKEQKQHRVRKNLLQNTGTSRTINGVTFTVNSDGSVTCNTDENGATATAIFDVYAKNFTLAPDNYILSGCPIGGDRYAKYKLDAQVFTNGFEIWIADIGDGVNIYSDKTITILLMSIVIFENQVCDNLTFFPMLRKASIEDDTYEPYIINTELDITLPALPTLSGTNTLSVGTEVQPSKVYIKGEKEREYT